MTVTEYGITASALAFCCYKMEVSQSLATPRSLREICFQAIRTHFSTLGANAVLAIPTALIRDLLPHLTVCQLDEVQPALNVRGISTFPGWFSVLQDLSDHYSALDFNTEEKAKHEVMRYLFPLVFYGFKNHYILKNSSNLKNKAFLWAAAKCNKQFLLIPSIHKPLQTLTSEQRPLLTLLEERIKTVSLSHSLTLSESSKLTVLYILHRLLDHGSATELVLTVECPTSLAWILHGRGTQYVNPVLRSHFQSSCIHSASSDVASHSLGPEGRTLDGEADCITPCKRPRLEKSEGSNLAWDPHVLCAAFEPGAGPCPCGKITHLELRKCGVESFKFLNPALETFYSLHSLTLHSCTVRVFCEAELMNLAMALKKLSSSSCSSLSDLSISILPHPKLMEILLDASPRLKSLYVEIQSGVLLRPRFNPSHFPAAVSDSSAELSLEKLTVKITDHQTDLQPLTSVLSRSLRLASLHISGIRPTGSTLSQFLTALPALNVNLRVLSFEDVKLCDCLPEILNLLGTCKLEELTLSDCRLLEKCSNQEERLLQLVAALKTLPSLHKLSLAQNRLAKNVGILAELFSGPSPSSVKHLNISSNFILPPYLLEFAERLRTHTPKRRLVLDLRKNPADRDLSTWTRAVQRLQPIAALLTERWKSTDMMVDHVSNM